MYTIGLIPMPVLTIQDNNIHDTPWFNPHEDNKETMECFSPLKVEIEHSPQKGFNAS